MVIKKMKNFHHFIVSISGAILFVLLVGVAFADIPVHAVPGLTGISTSTSMDTQGIATTSTAVGLQLGSYTLNDPPLENGGYQWVWWAGFIAPPILGYTVDPWVAGIYGTPVPTGEVQYTSVYNEDLTSVSGGLIYQKTMSINTANKSAGEENIATNRLATFIGGDGSRMTTSENILLDGEGAQTIGANQLLCPFTSTANPFFPPFCNIAVSGSSADISTGFISTSAGVRFIVASADVPVTETYNINVGGVSGPGGYTDAYGVVNAFMKAHIQEGKENEVQRWFDSDPLGYNPVKAEDFVYSESSMASGSISRFTKNIQYQSGIRLV